MKIVSKKNSLLLLFLTVLIFLLGIVSIFPILEKIPSHPDEYQFYINAFAIMGGKELPTYIHVAVTEYLLVGFFYLVNLFTSSGVNFPQGDPSLVTHYYGKIFSLCLYALTFLVACIILQRGDNKIKARTAIFSVLYFGSIGLMERFLRVNSDSMGIFVFLNYLIFSFWLHRQKASVSKFFFLNLIFVFLTSFTNLKSLYLIMPIAVINTLVPFIWYDLEIKGKIKLPKIYRFILYCLGILFGSVFLWTVFMPKPFNNRVFWYGIKNTIVYGAKFDFNYPGQAFGSWKVYLYDLVTGQIGLSMVLAMTVLLTLSYFVTKKNTGKNIFKSLFERARSQINLDYLKSGNLERMTEIILLLSFLTYYFGVSLVVIHWSRWGAPLGLLMLMLLSVVLEKALEPIFLYWNKSKAKLFILLFVLFAVSWSLRLFLSIDIRRSKFYSSVVYSNTHNDVQKFLEEKNISSEDALKQVFWLAVSYTYNVGTLTWDMFTNPSMERRGDVKYIFWPSWNMGPVFTAKNVDKSTHNQRALIEQITDSVSYRFPSITSRYIHFTKLLAWKYLGLTWTPETENMIEPEYAVIKIKDRIGTFSTLRTNYVLPFKDMSHYYFPYSLVFNIKNLPDGYMFPPCFGYANVKDVNTGLMIESPPELGSGGKTAGLYCHGTWFRISFKGTYRIQIEGLPDDPEGVQRIFSNVNFDWIPNTKTIIFNASEMGVAISFGVATKERYPRKLKFIIDYSSY